ncbi:LysM peptidoglycan-binding domain-containing protein [Cellulomonas sp. C5510]|uniref:LysM peptidoglycan-binding domain-containing protein n=1 Tax=Cellulomonas sp. C5510 TaxID=2871170 RepID=UPI001C94EDAF|nr:LysM peptidoglycan-binding domain-containing protein [Cellulomonas sp. C5510]QZN84484.1 LysM peptidoglycan-binding domain-containing protein [Cellulomonas sp. C5510]
MSAIAVHPRLATRPAADRPARPRPVAVRSAAAQAEGRARPAARVTATPEASLHLTRRGRAVLLVLALLVVLGGVVGGRAVADGPRQATEVTTHAVVAGETLWQIATDVAAPGEDVRDVVLRLQELNGLPDASLLAGQVLLLPAGS